jgi:hypothetical protein
MAAIGNAILVDFTLVSDAGITLCGKLPIETSRVTRNCVSGSGPALFLHQGPADAVAAFFGSTVSLNDFMDYTIAVRTNNVYNLPAELSDPLTLQGNYWGLPCPEGFDPNLVQFLSGNINPFVKDSHPYGEPIAETPDSLLPTPCRDE